jgi:hypothetical protein
MWAAAGSGAVRRAAYSRPPIHRRRRHRHGKKALRRAARAAAAAADASLALPLLRRERDPAVACLEPEAEEGNVEFKLMLTDTSPSRYEQLVTQMKFRLEEGKGEAFYYIGGFWGV